MVCDIRNQCCSGGGTTPARTATAAAAAAATTERSSSMLGCVTPAPWPLARDTALQAHTSRTVLLFFQGGLKAGDGALALDARALGL